MVIVMLQKLFLYLNNSYMMYVECLDGLFGQNFVMCERFNIFDFKNSRVKALWTIMDFWEYEILRACLHNKTSFLAWKWNFYLYRRFKTWNNSDFEITCYGYLACFLSKHEEQVSNVSTKLSKVIDHFKHVCSDL